MFVTNKVWGNFEYSYIERRYREPVIWGIGWEFYSKTLSIKDYVPCSEENVDKKCKNF